MTGINFITGFIKNKVYSIFLGLSGLGILSQFSSSLSFLLFLLPLGFPLGITKLIADSNKSDKSQLRDIIHSSLILLVIPILVSILITLAYSTEISIFLFNDSSYSNYIKIFSIVFPFLIIVSIQEAVFKGLGDISQFVKSVIYSSIISLIISIPAVIIFGIPGAIFGLSIYYIFFTFYSFTKMNISNIYNFEFKYLKFNAKLMGKIIKIGFAFLIAGALYQFTLIYLKRMVIEEYGFDGGGMFQSVLNISLFYFGFIFTSMSSYTFTKIVTIKNNSDLSIELNNTTRFIIFIMVPLIIVLIVFRYFILLLLYTSEFLVTEPFFQYQFLGDFLKALSWVLGIWLIPKLKIFYFLILELLLNINLIAIFQFLIVYTDVNIEGVSLAYLISYLIHFILNFLIAREIIGFKFMNKNIKLILSSILIIVTLTYFSFINLNYGYLLFLPLFSIWVFMNITFKELKEMKLMLTGFLNAKFLNK